jgi:NAD(P)-dependent dehydrogenase (short-subunit alcohol dehydrogenase family)
MRLDDRVFIVTGAAGNLGAAIATDLAGRGARLVLVDRVEPPLTALAATLPNPDKVLRLAGLDLTKPDDMARMASATLERFGRIDGLVNTVGGFRMGRVSEDALAGWDFLMDINARATLVASAAVLPAMVSRKSGRIVHIAAAIGLKGVAGMAVYSASKAAVMRIVEALADEHRADGVTVNCILPVTIDTPQNRAAMPTADTSAWVAPAAIARAVAALLSEEAGAITGASIPVAGVG